jgi:hypothetical protein
MHLYTLQYGEAFDDDDDGVVDVDDFESYSHITGT